MDNQILLKNERIGKLLVRYSVPAILAMMVTSLYNTVDRAFIGSIKDIGALAISGLGVTMPLFTILGAFCVAIAIGGSTQISIKLGEGNKEEAEKILGSMVALEFVVGMFMVLVGLLFLDDILYLFGASQTTITYAREYMSVIMAASWFNLPGFALNSAIRAEGNPKLAARMMITTCILNVILDPIFIFIFNRGIEGAAIGTIICQLIVFLWSMYYFTRGNSILKLKWHTIKIKRLYFKMIVLIGLTPFFMELASGSIHVVTNRILQTYGGDLAIGAMTAITSIGLIFLMPVYGISQGMQTIIAYNYGANEKKRIKHTLILAMVGATVILMIGSLLMRFFPEFFVGIFTQDQQLKALALNGMRINLGALSTIGISVLGAVYFQTIGESKIAIVLSLLRQVILLIPIMIVLPQIYGLKGVWLAQPIADLVAMMIIIGMVIKKWHKNQVT